jgi:serine/threonine-protein kinase HipA
MRVGQDEADSTIANALSMAAMFSLTKKTAAEEVREVVGVVDQWKQHFKKEGVTAGDIDLYAEQIDRAYLADQRAEWR